MMSSTRTVMMAMVITRFVAILETPHVSRCYRGGAGTKNFIPTSDPFEALDAAVNVAFAFVQDPGGMLDRLALLLQLRKRAGSDGLGLVRQCLAGLEALCAAIQSVRPCKRLALQLERSRLCRDKRTRQQLLPLLKVGIP